MLTAVARRLTERPAWIVLVLLVIAGLGWVLRAGPVICGGTFTVGTDYDDAVNFSAAGLLVDGAFPYRDFFYAHPPGGLLALAPFAAVGRWIGYDRAFSLAGFGMMLVGALNVFLLGRFAWRAWGPVAGITAASLYAIHPHVLVAERTTFMEPLLNLACITMATLWLGGDGVLSDRRAFAAGIAAGAAISFKLWAVVWVLAALAAIPRDRPRAALARFALGGASVFVVAVVPLALVGIGSVFDDLVRFHVRRPPDGLPHLQRFDELLGFLHGSRNVFTGPHAPTSLLALSGLAVALLRLARRRAGRAAGAERAERLAATAYVLTIGWLVASGVYYTHYNAHLALSETLLAGLGASTAWEALRRFGEARRDARTAVAAAGAIVVMGMVAIAVPVSADWALDDARVRVVENRAIGPEIRQLPKDACVFAFEPVWTLSAGRMPSPAADGTLIPDPYGAMLFTSIGSGTHFRNVEAAFADDASQGDIRRIVSGCDYLVLGWRGFWQLSDASEDEMRTMFDPRPAGPSGLEIWERRRPN